jgi:hypothetical protein
MDMAWDDRRLRRFIALLVSFAVLAERAAGRSLPVRFIVLVILRHAEAVAIASAADATGMDLSCFDDDAESGFGPMDAAVLSQRLRTLAAVLSAFLPASGPVDGRDIAPPRGGASFAHPVFVVCFGTPQGFCDTS